jgi:hypothetical protein
MLLEVTNIQCPLTGYIIFPLYFIKRFRPRASWKESSNLEMTVVLIFLIYFELVTFCCILVAEVSTKIAYIWYFVCCCELHPFNLILLNVPTSLSVLLTYGILSVVESHIFSVLFC